MIPNLLSQNNKKKQQWEIEEIETVTKHSSTFERAGNPLLSFSLQPNSSLPHPETQNPS